MSEWSSRPRTTPMAGRRKATLRYCVHCREFHRTHRHSLGEEICPREDLFSPVKPSNIDFPHVRLKPRT